MNRTGTMVLQCFGISGSWLGTSKRSRGCGVHCRRTSGRVVCGCALHDQLAGGRRRPSRAGQQGLNGPRMMSPDLHNQRRTLHAPPA